MRGILFLLPIALVGCGDEFTDVSPVDASTESNVGGSGGGTALGGAAGAAGKTTDASSDTHQDAPDAPNDSAESSTQDVGKQCPSGKGDCDGTGKCATDLQTDEAHCGTCTQACSGGAHAEPACVKGVCGLSCNAGFGDCDTEESTGCEVDLAVSSSHCGVCGKSCPSADHADPTCSSSKCGIQCQSGWGNCDSDDSTGCEKDLTSDLTNCGQCGHACGTANGTPSCTTGSCAIQCSEGWADCDGDNANGCETNTLTSDSHCGACNHSCHSDGCAQGKCIAITVATAIGQPVELADAGQELIVTSKPSSVLRIAKAGGTTINLATGQMNPESVVVDSATAYWTTYGTAADGAIVSAALPSGSPQTIASNLHNPRALGIDSTTIYYIEGGTGSSKVRKVAKTGGTPITMVDAQDNGIDLVVGSIAVYWTSGETAGKVQSVPKGSTVSLPIATGQNFPFGIALEGTQLFWSNEFDGQIMRYSLGGGVPELVIGAVAYPGWICVDATSIYYVSNKKDVSRVSKTGGTPTVLSGNETQPGHMIVDGTHLYWLTPTAVRRVAL